MLPPVPCPDLSPSRGQHLELGNPTETLMEMLFESLVSSEVTAVVTPLVIVLVNILFVTVVIKVTGE